MGRRRRRIGAPSRSFRVLRGECAAAEPSRHPPFRRLPCKPTTTERRQRAGGGGGVGGSQGPEEGRAGAPTVWTGRAGPSWALPRAARLPHGERRRLVRDGRTWRRGRRRGCILIVPRGS